MADSATIVASFTSIPLPFLIIALIIVVFVIASAIDKRLLWVRPGQIGVIWNRVTGVIIAGYREPGRYRIGRLHDDLRALRFTVDQPVLVYSGTIKARTADGETIWLVVSLALTITSPDSYVMAVVQRQLESWCQRELTIPIAAVVRYYTIQQIRDRPEEITSRIAAEVAPRLSPNLGLAVSQASFVKVWTARASVPSRPTLARVQARELTRPDPLGQPRFRFGALSARQHRAHLDHHGRETPGQVMSINYRSGSSSGNGYRSGSSSGNGRSSTSSSYATTIAFESDGTTYTIQETTSSRPAVPEGGFVTIRYCPYFPTRCAQADVRQLKER